MSRSIAAVLVVAAVWASGAAAAKAPKPELFGVRIGMTQAEVKKSLASRGELQHEEEGARGARQYWQVEDERYRWVAVRFNRDRAVEWITAFVREDGPGVRYDEVADVELARVQGNYFYTWLIPLAQGGGSDALQARGTDPERLHSLSLYRTKEAPPAKSAKR